MLNGINAAVSRSADADAKPRKVAGPKSADDGAHAVVPAGAALRSHPHNSKRQIHFVYDDQYLIKTAAKPPHHRANNVSAVVHIRAGQHQANIPPANVAASDNRSVGTRLELNVVPQRETLNSHSACVVPRVSVPGHWVAQSKDKQRTRLAVILVHSTPVRLPGR